MNSKKKILVASIIFTIIFFSIFNADILATKNKKHTAKKTNKKKRELVSIESKKISRIQTLYEYFPLYEQWEKAEIYPYNDFAFLNNYDRKSVFEDYFLRKKLIDRLNDWMGVRYRCPGRSRAGVDCSNFVSIIIDETLGLSIPAGSSTQATLYPKVDNLEDLQFGDLIFFSGRNKKSKRIGHVGIYIANGLFAHSSTGKGVIYTHISDGYYSERYRYGGRIIKDLAI